MDSIQLETFDIQSNIFSFFFFSFRFSLFCLYAQENRSPYHGTSQPVNKLIK